MTVSHGRACVRCDLWKPASDFYRRADGAAGGLYSCCKLCWNTGAPAKLRQRTVIDGQKRCSKCREWKPFDAFGARRKGDRAGKNQMRSWCLACGSAYVNSEAGRQGRYASRYGVTLQWYEATLAAQGGRCAACGNLPAGRRLAIDHDHRCCDRAGACGNCVRGLLCEFCNNALGMFKDSIETITQAIEYLGSYENVGVVASPKIC
jgi:hypothetical protein